MRRPLLILFLALSLCGVTRGQALLVGRDTLQYRYTPIVAPPDSLEVRQKTFAEKLSDYLAGPLYDRTFEKKIDVLKVYVFTPEEVVQQEIALYKVAHNKDVEKLVREQHVRILEVEDDCIVLEKTGYTNETQALFELLKPYGVFQFVRSGTVAVSRYNKELLEEYI